MTYKIAVHPAGVHFQSDGNLLDDALAQSIPLQHSCKTGECGTCSAEVLSGEVENVYGEVICQGGDVLICESKALSDVVLRASYYPELASLKIQTLPCKVSSVNFIAEDIVVIKLRFPPTAAFDYLPGQYVDLNYKGIRRSYSIANAKRVSEGLELHIRKVVDGKMSGVIFSDLKENQLMRIEGPKGTFFIREGNKPLILLAGGTGIAPVKAMLEELVANQDKRDVYIYWGMSNKNSFYLKEFALLAAKHSHIHYISVLSSEERWQGRMGLVHQAVCDDFASLKDYQIYACGSPLMIDAAKIAFIQKQLPSDQFFSDAFTPAK